jgi:predicted ester cyclase
MVEELKARIRRVADEAYNKGNLDALDEAYATNIVRHAPRFPDIEGLEALKQSTVDARSAFPDIQMTIDEMVVEGDTYALRYTWRGTHTGQSPTQRIQPTGKRVTGRGCLVGHRVGGKTIEEWDYPDTLGLLQQLGVVPPLEQGGG